MSDQSFYASRLNARNELAQLAKEHFKHDLTEHDREVVTSSAQRAVTYTGIGSALGLGLGLFLAMRRRQVRARMFQHFVRAEKPTHVRFADGHEQPIPDISAALAPSTIGTVATYAFFGLIGSFLGTELGAVIGTGSAQRALKAEPETQERVSQALARLRIDMLRKQIEMLEKKTGSVASDVGEGEKLLEESEKILEE